MKSFWEWGKSNVYKNFVTSMDQKTRSTESEKWRYERNSVEIAWTNGQKADLKWLRHRMVVTKILTTNLKNIAGRPDVQFKEFSWLKKTRPRYDYEWIGKTIPQKNQIKKQKNNVKMPHVDKRTTSEKWRFCSNKKTRTKQNYEWIGEKSTSENAIFCSNTVF